MILYNNKDNRAISIEFDYKDCSPTIYMGFITSEGVDKVITNSHSTSLSIAIMLHRMLISKMRELGYEEIPLKDYRNCMDGCEHGNTSQCLICINAVYIQEYIQPAEEVFHPDCQYCDDDSSMTCQEKCGEDQPAKVDGEECLADDTDDLPF